MKDFSIIVAMDLDGAIGNSKTNDIPWHLPADFAHFKEQTLGKTIVMGSRTWDSLPFKPLKGRRNVVISSQPLFDGVDKQYTTLEEALEKEENVIVIGGSRLYEEALKHGPSILHLTIVDLKTKGDVKYPYTGKDMLAFGSFRRGEHTWVNIKNAEHVDEKSKAKFTISEWRKMPLAKLTSERYQFVAYEVNGIVTVELEDTETGQKKTFTKADGSLQGYINHMNSLTDELCESWFSTGKRKKGKKNA